MQREGLKTVIHGEFLGIRDMTPGPPTDSAMTSCTSITFKLTDRLRHDHVLRFKTKFRLNPLTS